MSSAADGPNRAVFTGFDSAWTAGNRGAIAHATLIDGAFSLVPPEVAGFDEALQSIEDQSARADLHVIGIDQPLIVPNETGCRPVERVLTSLISRLNGGMQPANRGKAAMFGDSAPIWPFLRDVRAELHWRKSDRATHGRYAIEVYPAAAIAGLFPAYCERGRLPKYNPANRAKFCLEDWRSLCELTGSYGRELGIAGVQDWCQDMASLERPGKSDQDGLDAVICVLITYLWWQSGRERSHVVGDLATGYIVVPVNPVTSAWIRERARLRGVPVDAVVIDAE